MMLRQTGPLLLALLMTPLCVPAAGNDRQQPVQLRADRIDVDQKKGLSLYRGHVVFRQGTLQLTAARAEVQNQANVVETVTAEGQPVTFRHRPEGTEALVEGEARRAVYHAPTRSVHLYDDVQLQRGRDLFRSSALHYDIENDSMIAEGTSDQRVYAALVPNADRQPVPAEGNP